MYARLETFFLNKKQNKPKKKIELNKLKGGITQQDRFLLGMIANCPTART